MNEAVEDKSARIFSESLYQALGDGRSIRAAFEIAVNEAKLDNTNGNPLISESSFNAANYKFIN